MNLGLEKKEVIDALLENEAYGIFVTDVSGRILASNKVIKDILKISAKDSENNINDYYDNPKDRHLLLEKIKTIGHAVYETRIVNASGDIIWTKTAVKGIKYNGEDAMLSIVENVNDKKEIEFELIEQQDQEKIIRSITVNLLNTDFTDIEESINSSLKIVGEFYNVDYVAFIAANVITSKKRPQYFWVRDIEAYENLVKNNFDFDFSWINDLFEDNDSLLYCSRYPNELKPNERQRHFFSERKILSYAGCTIRSMGIVDAYFSISSFSEKKLRCPKNLLNALSILLENFYNIMQKKETFFMYNIFRYAVENSQDAIVYFDNNYSIQACNDFFRKLFMIEDLRISEIYMDDIFSSHLITIIRDLHFEKCMHGNKQYIEQWYEFKDGTKRFVGFYMYPFKNDQSNVIGIVMIIQDKTENYKNETEILNLREEERQKIGLELHDDLSHDLLEIAIGANTIAAKIKSKDKASYENLKKLEKKINMTLEKTRALSKKFCSFYDFEQNMYSIIKKIVVNNAGLGIKFNINCKKNLNIKNPFKSEGIYYILSESIVNIAKHTTTKKILIDIEDVNNIIYLKIKSDGISKENKQQSKTGIGFKIMKCRARIIEASLDYEIKTDGSTEVFLNLQNN